MVTRTVLWGTLDPMGRSRSDTPGTPLVVRVCEDTSGLSKLLARAIRAYRLVSPTHQAYRTRACNLDTRSSFPSGESTNIHRQRNSNHTSHTTSSPACVSSCTHARIHRHLLSYIDLSTNAYRPWPVVEGRAYGSALASEAGSSLQMGMYGGGDNAMAQEGSPQASG